MTPHDLFTLYSIKAVEYFLAVAFLLFFIPFWRFLNGGRIAERSAVAEAPGWLGTMRDWFLVSDQVRFHPGHAWASIGDGDVVTVGMDDFAQKLLGRISAVELPKIGSQLHQGEKGWSLLVDSKSVDMLSPVGGTVTAVNEGVLDSPKMLNLDPFGRGWLLKVKAPKKSANMKQLLKGNLARQWMEEECDRIEAIMTPDLGRLYQDGGLPIHGMARALKPEDWDEIVREFFLT